MKYSNCYPCYIMKFEFDNIINLKLTIRKHKQNNKWKRKSLTILHYLGFDISELIYWHVSFSKIHAYLRQFCLSLNKKLFLVELGRINLHGFSCCCHTFFNQFEMFQQYKEEKRYIFYILRKVWMSTTFCSTSAMYQVID